MLNRKFRHFMWGAVLVTISSFAFSQVDGLNEFGTSTTYSEGGVPMAYIDKQEIAFRQLYGLTTYTGENPEVLSRLQILDESDISLIIQSVTSTSFTAGAMKILSDACEYYNSTPFSQLDAVFLARHQKDANELGKRDREIFIQQLYEGLSLPAKTEFLSLVESIDSSRHATIQKTETDHIGLARKFPERVKTDFSTICSRLPSMQQARENGQATIKTTVISFEEK